MTNNNNHHSNTRAFSEQSYTNNEQILPTSGPVLTGQHTNSGGDTRLPRMSPLDASSLGISRSLARQPASPTGEWRIDRPTHNHLTDSNGHLLSHQRQAVTLLQFDSHHHNESRANTPRPNTGTNSHPSGHTTREHTPIDPDNTQKAFTPAQRPSRGVRQDKDRNSCDRAASLQPAAVKEFTRLQVTRRKSPRSKKGDSDNRRCVPVQVWVSPLVKDELSRIASSDGLSLSSAGAALLERGIQQNVDMQYGALLRPIIEDAIARQMAGIATRLTWLLVRIAFDAGQTRSLVTNILGKQLDKNQPLFKTILDGSARSAKANIMRRTPQISELISSVEQWMTEDNRGVSNKKIHD